MTDRAVAAIAVALARTFTISILRARTNWHLASVAIPEIGNLAIGDYELVETITLPITTANWYYSRIRVIGNVVD